MPPKEEKKPVSLMYLAVLLVLWYALNVQYNLYNKKILNVWPYPYTVSLIQVKNKIHRCRSLHHQSDRFMPLLTQLGSGLFYILPVWLLRIGGRSFPTNFSVSKMGLLGSFHGCGHFATVISLGMPKPLL
jgi:hypothetical protein